MEILDEENLRAVHFRLPKRVLLYFIYLGITLIGFYWNMTGSVTRIWLPYDFGLSGGCYIELPMLLTLGLGGVLITLVLLPESNLSFSLFLKALILVIASSSTSFFIMRYFKLTLYVPLEIHYSRKMDLCHGGLNFLLFIAFIETYILYYRR